MYGAENVVAEGQLTYGTSDLLALENFDTSQPSTTAKPKDIPSTDVRLKAASKISSED